MKRKVIYILSLLCLSSMTMAGQTPGDYFNTVGVRCCNASVTEQQEDSTVMDDSGICESKSPGDEYGYSMLSVPQLENLIARYEGYIQSKRQPPFSKTACNSRILSYYEGESHDLNINNLISVVGEVGLSNQLFVLAQAVLETGHFTSHVCKEYNNLFGLYDSRHHDYYRFSRWEDSVVGYQKFIQYRYKGGNYLRFLDRIGYAEGKNYTKKVAEIAKQLYHQLFPD